MPQNIKPRFEVHARPDDVVTETFIKRKDDRNVEYEKEVPYGYDVYFPAGHSLRIRTKEELQRLGFEHGADLIDMESGDHIAKQNISLKQNVQRRTSASKKHNAASSSVDANQ